MLPTHSGHILTLNGGSSSIKFALFVTSGSHNRLFSGSIDRIGLADAIFTVKSAAAKESDKKQIEAPNHERAVGHLLNWLNSQGFLSTVIAVGHRIVHGGPRFTEPQQVTPDLLNELRRLSPIDPAHLPGEIALIEAVAQQHSHVPQVACFDTAFHKTMPRAARLLPIPRKFEAVGVHRYGFHGLSYAYLMEELARLAGPQAALGRIILAHLGNGASMAAVRDGKCIDTSMSFTPTAGLVMGTRTGDLDPGVLVYLMRQNHFTVDQIDELVNKQSGLMGISEISSDMRDLLSRQTTDERAADAVNIFCYAAKKWIGAFSAALGGLDTLVFAGGIGEHAPEIRERICEGLTYLGITIDADRNKASAPIISRDGSAAQVRIIATDEELMIAKLVSRVLQL